jgi:hypothetical protein
MPVSKRSFRYFRSNLTKIKKTYSFQCENYIFWDITPDNLLKVNGSFGGIFRVHLHTRRISEAGNQCESR